VTTDPDDGEPAGSDNTLAAFECLYMVGSPTEQDVDTASGNGGSHGDRTRCAGIGEDLSLVGIVAGGQQLVGESGCGQRR
jgi:hypothetical protein